MAVRPDLLVLDEPSNHVDEGTRDSLIRAVRAYEGSGSSSAMTSASWMPFAGSALSSRRSTEGRTETVCRPYRGGFTQVLEEMAARDLRNRTLLGQARGRRTA